MFGVRRMAVVSFANTALPSKQIRESRFLRCIMSNHWLNVVLIELQTPWVCALIAIEAYTKQRIQRIAVKSFIVRSNA